MKGKVQAPLSFSDDLNKPESAKSSESTQRDSPYLKAILSGSVDKTTRVVQMVLSDKLAAIRYIQESKWRNRFCRV
ncbi:MAG: hypothetical protein ACO25B_10350 [Chitinophagaceae bacterium]